MSDNNKSKQAFWILIGSLSGFLFSIISTILLSRHLDKSEYGTYRQILYIYDSLLIIFTLGLPKTYSFFLPRIKINQAKASIRKITNILSVTGLLMGFALYFGAEIISEALQNRDLTTPLRYFSVVPVFLLPTMGLEGVLATFKKTKWLAIYNIATRALLLLSVSIPVVIFDNGINSAVIGFAVASFISFVIAKFLRERPLRSIKPEEADLSYKEIFEYSLPILFAGLWGMIITSTDQFLISHYFGTEVFAEFSNGALQLPFVAMVVSATSIVLAPIYSKKAFDNNKCSNAEIVQIWDSVLSKTIKLTYPLLIFFICFSTEVMLALYGDQYRNSGNFFQIKLLADFFTLITFGPLLLSIGGNKFYHDVHMYGAALLIFIQLIIINIAPSPIHIVWISVICHITRIIAMLWFISKHFNISIYTLIPWKLTGKILAPSLIMGISTKFLLETYTSIDNTFLLLTFAGLLYFSAYILWSCFAKIDYLSIIRPLLNKRD